MELETEIFDIGNMLESLMDIFSVQCTLKGLEVGLDMDSKHSHFCEDHQSSSCELVVDVHVEILELISWGQFDLQMQLM